MAVAGTITLTRTKAGSHDRYSVAWVSDASGDVTENTIGVAPGYLMQVEYVPSSTAPSADYDVTLLNEDGADVLAGDGADLSATAAKITPISNPPFVSGTYTPTVDAAGDSKEGTIILTVLPV